MASSAATSQSRPHHPKKNTLSIRLTESAVFLRTDSFGPLRRNNVQTEGRPSMLRGLLVLELVKPTKITSIDVELTALTSTAWPEGVGAHRIEVREENRVFHATTTYFRAGQPDRRALSIGPGVSYLRPPPDGDDDSAEDVDDSSWDDLPGTRGRASTDGRPEDHVSGVSRSNSEVLPSSSTRRRRRFSSGLLQLRPSLDAATPTSPSSQVLSPSTPIPIPSASRSRRSNRRVSIDGSALLTRSAYETYHQDMPPIPPYSPLPPSSPSTSYTHPSEFDEAMSRRLSSSASALQSLDDFGASLQSTLRDSQNRASVLSLSPTIPEDAPPGISRSSTQRTSGSPYSNPESLSRSPSIPSEIQHQQFEYAPTPGFIESPSDYGAGPSLPRYSSSGGHHPHHQNHQHHHPQQQQHRHHHEADTASAHPDSTPTGRVRHSSPSVDRERRKSSRFSLSAVIDAVRAPGRRNDEPVSPTSGSSRRGRTLERFGTVESSTGSEKEGKDVQSFRERGREMFGRILGEKDKSGFKVFKPGTYTYPISFSIPSNAPPTMACDYGNVSWKLDASVHRPGTFKAKMSATREVIIVSCPTEEDTEESENIIVERHWDQQLQYLISVSGRSFYVGGKLPVTFTLMPLTKVRIHRISVVIEEKVDYYTHMRRVTRSDPPTNYTILAIKREGRTGEPILPLESEDVEVLRSSPLFQVIDPSSSSSTLDDIASSLMGPGPWTFHKDIPLPDSCDTFKFTNKNRRANMSVSHMLKLIMRVERGDDLYIDKHGKRKMFDIVVQTPVLILSCRCNPEWSSLPRYSEVFTSDHNQISRDCPCVIRRRALANAPRPQSSLQRVTTRASAAESTHSGMLSPGGESLLSPASATGQPTSPTSPSSTTLSVPTSLSRTHTANSANTTTTTAANTNTTSTAPTMQNQYAETMLRSSSLFERLVSGQESETGEAPPAYSDAVAVGNGVPRAMASNAVVVR